ncbi:hypothetical protein PR048_033498 [Dryococelus australis]|uniref:Uncharacterized protein n=1 Tax=Dryococelus australis TaxID=614101 RepID=A0ABQ9G0F8_9NEOP|nr:hypothetical protein PR048_033498 [Dryococelus australis]
MTQTQFPSQLFLIVLFADKQWLDYSPPKKANRVRFPVERPPDFRTWESRRDYAADWRAFSGICRFLCPCIPAPFRTHLISPSSGYQDSDIRSRPNLSTPAAHARKMAATVVQRLACSPLTKAIRVRSPDFRTWESCWTMPLVGGFSWGSPVSPAISSRRCSILTSITLIGSKNLNLLISDRDFEQPILAVRNELHLDLQSSSELECCNSFLCRSEIRSNHDGATGALGELLMCPQRHAARHGLSTNELPQPTKPMGSRTRQGVANHTQGPSHIYVRPISDLVHFKVNAWLFHACAPMSYPLLHDDNVAALVNISVLEDCISRPSPHLAVEKLKRCTCRKVPRVVEELIPEEEVTRTGRLSKYKGLSHRVVVE